MNFIEAVERAEWGNIVAAFRCETEYQMKMYRQSPFIYVRSRRPAESAQWTGWDKGKLDAWYVAADWHIVDPIREIPAKDPKAVMNLTPQAQKFREEEALLRWNRLKERLKSVEEHLGIDADSEGFQLPIPQRLQIIEENIGICNLKIESLENDVGRQWYKIAEHEGRLQTLKAQDTATGEMFAEILDRLEKLEGK